MSDSSDGERPGVIDASLPPPRRRRKKKKKKVVRLDVESARELEYIIQANMNQHTLASIYFSNQNFYVFTVTQASFTMMASIGAFAASSDLLTPISKVWLNLAVGSISAMVVFLQTMNGVCGFGERAGQHQNLAIDLRDLRDDIALLKLKLQKVKADKEKAKAQHGDGYSYTRIPTMTVIVTRTRTRKSIRITLNQSNNGINKVLLDASPIVRWN